MNSDNLDLIKELNKILNDTKLNQKDEFKEIQEKIDKILEKCDKDDD